MKTIYRLRQIAELQSLPPAERKAILRRNHYKRFKHWQGWAGFMAYTVCISAISLWRVIFPPTMPWWSVTLYIAAICAVGMTVYYITYCTTIAPYIRYDVERLQKQGFSMAETIGRTSGSSVFLTRGTPPAGQESRRGSESAEP